MKKTFFVLILLTLPTVSSAGWRFGFNFGPTYPPPCYTPVPPQPYYHPYYGYNYPYYNRPYSVNPYYRPYYVQPWFGFRFGGR